MAIFVLVHGAWGGAHGFRKVRGPLRAAGHEVFTPSLTGVGERVHLTSPQVRLTTHVTDVVNTVLYEDLHGIVLLGFSYGGFVITGALEHIGDRVRHLVYLDAFVPGDGDRAGATAGGRRRARRDRGRPRLAGAAAAPRVRRSGRGGVGERAAHAAAGRLLHRAGTADAPAGGLSVLPHLHQGDGGAPARPAGPFWAAADRARQSPAWRYREITTGHMVAVNRPGELVRILLELA